MDAPHLLLPWRLLLLLLLTLAGSSTASNGASAPAPAPKPVGFGYKLVSLVQRPNGGGLVGYLQVKQRTSTYGPDIPRLRLFVKHETKDRVRVQITDAAKQRWEVPYDLLPREPSPPLAPTCAGAAFTAAEYAGEDLVFTYGRDPFWFAVHRKSTGQPLFNTSHAPLVFKDQYLEVTTRLPGDAALYGLGENTQPGGMKLRPNDPYTLYTTDASAINLNTDLYGSHPVYVDLRSVAGRGVAHAVLLLNSNGMDVVYRGTSLTYKVIGGLLDFYFFAGPTPLAVVDQYTAMIGRPAPMPYWAFGSLCYDKKRAWTLSPYRHCSRGDFLDPAGQSTKPPSIRRIPASVGRSGGGRLGIPSRSAYRVGFGRSPAGGVEEWAARSGRSFVVAVGLSGGAARWSLSADRPLWPCVQVLGAVLHGVPSPVSMVRWSRTSEELEGLGDVEQSDDVGGAGRRFLGAEFVDFPAARGSSPVPGSVRRSSGGAPSYVLVVVDAVGVLLALSVIFQFVRDLSVRTLA